MQDKHSSRPLWAFGLMIGVCGLLLGLWINENHLEGGPYRISSTRALRSDPALTNILRDLRDELRTTRSQRIDSVTNTARGASPSSVARGVDAVSSAPSEPHVFPPADLPRVISLRRWHEDSALRQRWFLLTRRPAAEWFGVPNKVNIGNDGAEMWNYRIDGDERWFSLVFHNERLIDVIH